MSTCWFKRTKDKGNLGIFFYITLTNEGDFYSPRVLSCEESFKFMNINARITEISRDLKSGLKLINVHLKYVY